MSFISILKKVGGAILGIEHTAEPIIKVLVPGAAPILAILDPIFARLDNAIKTVELNAAPGVTGVDKAQAVIADFEAGLEVAQEIAAADGHAITYDKAELQAGIDSLVAGYKHLAAVKASIKTVPAANPAP